MMNFDLNSWNTMLQSALGEMLNLVSTYVPNLLAGLAILVIGWLLALLIASIVGGILGRSKLEEALIDSFGEQESSIALPKRVKSLTFYIIMLFVLVAFFQSLGLTLITEPLNELLNEIFAYLPRILAATGLLLVAWLIATLVKKLLNTVFEKSNLDKKLCDKTGNKDGIRLSASISETVYWLIFLLILPVVLNTLSLNSVLGPVNDMFSKFLGHIPNIFSAGVILIVGWFVARIVQRLTTNLLGSIGADGFCDNMGFGKAIGENKISDIIGLIVYVLILFPVLISALDALSLDAIAQPATNMLNTIFSAFPMIFAALIMLAIAVFVGRLTASLVENLLSSVGFDKLISLIGIKENKLTKGQAAPSHVIGNLTLIGVLLFATMEAFNMIGLSAISGLLNQFILFAGQILMGLIILIAGLILSNIAAQAIRSTVATNSDLLAMVARVAILILTGAMGLREMGFASEIVNLTIGIFFGAIGVSAALAFGLGCQDIASKSVSKWLDSLK